MMKNGKRKPKEESKRREMRNKTTREEAYGTQMKMKAHGQSSVHI